MKASPDVVVVGGGAAGCVIAARLSETPDCSVLLVEAGPDPRPSLPEAMRSGWLLTREFDWGYTTHGEELGAVQNVRRGRMLGGTAWYTRYALRGAVAGYDEWEKLGAAGWNFGSMLPYLKRLERDLEFGDEPWHGNAGPIPVTRYPKLESSEAGEATMRAFEACGFPLIDDHNRPGAIGAGRMPMNSRDGVRVIAAQAYLPEGGRPSLTVRPEAQVDRVLFEGGRAAGVALAAGTTIHAGCVVLSAGTYGSPCILMRSGIGPAQHLRSIGVDVGVDLPGLGVGLGIDVGVDVDCGYRGEARNVPHFRYVATFHSSESPESGPPDLMLWPADPYGDPPAYTIDVALLQPRSRGRVQLRSPSPTDAPRIQLRPLTEASDVRRLAEGHRRAHEVASSSELRRVCPGPPSPQAIDVKANAYPLPHAFGTCVMGRSPDAGAVVDTSGRVYGTEGLFVADASIMPRVPSGFTHMPTMALAERLAEELVRSLA